MGSPVPSVDFGVRERLTARFGAEVGGWFDELPGVLSALAERWQVEFGSPIPRGSMSVVIRCRMSDGRAAVLKVSPDRTRLAHEAGALTRWMTVHTPSVLAHDESAGALLIEAIEPGTPLVVSSAFPTPSNILDGGERRGLVAIDPAPCLGDAAFDAIDLLLWQADDVETVEARADLLAPAIGTDPSRLIAWCTAFAGMTALELAGSPGTSRDRIQAVVRLASRRS